MKPNKEKHTLSNRMQTYEDVNRQFLTKRLPVIIRLDGVAFHTFTKLFKKPFDERITSAMMYTGRELLKNIQGAQLVFGQSDELSILLRDYDTVTTESWFDYNINKLVSVSSSIATLAFDAAMQIEVDKERQANALHLPCKYRAPNFDSRAFNLPKEEVANYFIYRQNDILRNSVSMIAHSIFSQKELEGKSSEERKRMIEEKSPQMKWENIPTIYTRGFMCNKDGINMKLPLFKEDRSMVDNEVYIKNNTIQENKNEQ